MSLLAINNFVRVIAKTFKTKSSSEKHHENELIHVHIKPDHHKTEMYLHEYLYANFQ